MKAEEKEMDAVFGVTMLLLMMMMNMMLLMMMFFVYRSTLN